MTRIQFVIGLTLTLLITAAAGILHGRLSDRWGGNEIASQAAQQLESLPDQFGSWRLEQKKPLSETELSQLRPYGYVNRTYVHLVSGQRVSFFVLVGPVGQTAVHNPEVCYSSRDYTIIQPKEPTSVRVGGQRADEFLAMTFRSNSMDRELLRVYYGWSDGTTWDAEQEGRFRFAGLPFLYKIQLAAVLPSGADVSKEDACRLFLGDLIPVLRTHMVSARS